MSDLDCDEFSWDAWNLRRRNDDLDDAIERRNARDIIFAADRLIDLGGDIERAHAKILNEIISLATARLLDDAAHRFALWTSPKFSSVGECRLYYLEAMPCQ